MGAGAVNRLGPQRSRSEMHLLCNVKPKDASGGLLGLRGPRVPAYRPAVTLVRFWAGRSVVVWPPHSASPSLASVWTRTQVLSCSCRVDPGAWLRVEPQKGKRVRPASSSPASGRQEGGTRGPLGFCLQRGPRVPRGGSWGRAGVGQGSPSGRAGTRPPAPGELV